MKLTYFYYLNLRRLIYHSKQFGNKYHFLFNKSSLGRNQKVVSDKVLNFSFSLQSEKLFENILSDGGTMCPD